MKAKEVVGGLYVGLSQPPRQNVIVSPQPSLCIPAGLGVDGLLRYKNGLRLTRRSCRISCTSSNRTMFKNISSGMFFKLGFDRMSGRGVVAGSGDGWWEALGSPRFQGKTACASNRVTISVVCLGYPISNKGELGFEGSFWHSVNVVIEQIKKEFPRHNLPATTT